MDERNYWLGFSADPATGPAKFRKILAEFGSAKAAWETTRRRLARRRLERGDLFSIEKYLGELEKKSVWFVTLEDEEYPQILKEIKNPPFVLYGRGERKILKQVQDDIGGIAVVGARKTTQYGRDVTKMLTQDLVLNGFTIVSGLALGVDAISHATALENNGKTIAILGCGVDCCNPAENSSLYNSILEKGSCIVSEFPLGMRPTKWSFPARNRIIAGLSSAVLVTEGAEDSGSLITANFAFKFNRKVFAVPGPITSSNSKAPFKLLEKGAKLVTKGEDILKELKIQKSKGKITTQNSKVWNATEEERKILDLLENEEMNFDEIVRKTKFKSSTLSSLLSMMEIKGMIKSKSGGTYALSA